MPRYPLFVIMLLLASGLVSSVPAADPDAKPDALRSVFW